MAQGAVETRAVVVGLDLQDARHGLDGIFIGAELHGGVALAEKPDDIVGRGSELAFDEVEGVGVEAA